MERAQRDGDLLLQLGVLAFSGMEDAGVLFEHFWREGLAQYDALEGIDWRNMEKKILALTTQGRMQAWIMAALPSGMLYALSRLATMTMGSIAPIRGVLHRKTAFLTFQAISPSPRKTCRKNNNWGGCNRTHGDNVSGRYAPQAREGNPSENSVITKASPLVIARREAPWQSTRRFNFPERHGNLQGRLDCPGPAALAMTSGGVIARRAAPWQSSAFHPARSAAVSACAETHAPARRVCARTPRLVWDRQGRARAAAFPSGHLKKIPSREKPG
jgi:hypothetical protein